MPSHRLSFDSQKSKRQPHVHPAILTCGHGGHSVTADITYLPFFRVGNFVTVVTMSLLT
jgi:hypothetical protein